MIAVRQFLSGFVKRDGLSVLSSSFLTKLSGILLSIVVVRLLSVKDYGDIAFAISITGVLAAFGGIGSNWSLLRFGPGLPSVSSKFQMFRYTVRMGSRYTLPVIVLIIIASFFLPSNFKDSKAYLIILSFGILTTFLYQSLESYFRIICKNKIYSKFNVIGSVTLLVLTIALCPFLKGFGYVIAIVAAPLCSFLIFRRHVYFRNLESTKLPDRNFFHYGLYTSLGMIANQTTISLGPVVGGYLNAMPEEMARFRVATIIPFNLIMLPLLIMTTDFVHFSKNSDNPTILKEYYLQYLKSIFTISIIPFSILLIFNKAILILLFGNKYAASSDMSIILVLGVFFSYLFRIPLGNMLSAVGKSGWNVIHTFFWLIVFVPVSIYGYHLFGMVGIAASISCVFILSGFVSLFLFLFYLRTITHNDIKTVNSKV